MTQKRIPFSIVTIKENYYRFNIWFMTKNATVYRMKNANVSKEKQMPRKM